MEGNITIAFPTPEYVTETHFGGLATYLYKTTKYLNNLGHECIVFLLSNKNEDSVHEGVKLIYVRNKKPFWFWFINFCTGFIFNTTLSTFTKSLALRKAIIKYHKKQRISIIQYSNAQFLSVFPPHSINFCLRLSHFYFEYSKFIYEKPRSWKNIQKIYLEKYCIYKAKNKIYGPSSLITNMVERKMGIKVPVLRTPLFKISNAESKVDILSSSKYFLFYGTLSKSKGVDLIAKVIFDMLNTHKDINFKLVGRDTELEIKDDTIFTRLKLLIFGIQNQNTSTFSDLVIKSSGIYSDRVQYVPLVEPYKMQEIINNAFAIVLPSRIDNFPNTFSEAISNGKIVIVPNNSSLEEIIIHGESGFIFENGSHESLLKNIHHVMNLTDQEQLEISSQAIKTSERIDPRLVIERDLISFYNKILT